MIVYTELSTIEATLGIPIATLFAVSNHLSAHYKRVKLPKRDGTERELRVPDQILKRIQRAIAQRLLAYEPISPYAQAYRYGASVQANARPHVGREKLLKLDIKHFFDSILYSAVKEKCFPKERFSEPIRILLSMLCYFEDALPQGAPSSPSISNIIMRDFDREVGDYCRAREINYTRYCDDMTFSGHFDERAVIEFVKNTLFRYGFLLNRRKTAVIPAQKRQVVTGVVVNEKLNVSSDYKRRIRQELYYCKKYGVAAHLQRIGAPADEIDYLQSLLGRIAFVLQTVPSDPACLNCRNEALELLKLARTGKNKQIKI